MTKRDLQEAYDRMSPSQETKMRMLSNILPQEKGTGKHRARPQEQRRFSAIPAMLALAAVLTVCFLLLRPGDSILPLVDGPTETAASQPTEPFTFVEPEDYAAHFEGVPEQYQEILILYAQAIDCNWTKEQWQRVGLSVEMYSKASVSGYTLMDLDGNGSEELLICAGNEIYEIFAILGNEEREWVSGLISRTDVRTSLQLCEGNLVKSIETGDRFGGTYYTLYRMGNDGLGVMAMVSEKIVFVTADGDWYAGPNEKDAAPVTEAEARAIIDSYKIQKIDVQHFLEKATDKVDPISEDYQYILNKYVTAIEENWGGEQYMEHDMSYALVNFESAEQYGYTFLDIDGNDVEELLITDGTYLYDVYTLLEDGRGPGHLISAGERLRYFLCGDGLIGYQGSGSAFNTIWQFYRLENGIDLIPVQTLTLGTDVWYAGMTEDDAVEITHEEAQKILDKYRAKEIAFTPFMEFPG